MQYALRFISGKYQGGEFPLQPNREIVVGRSSELDMVLVEDMVSRKHAKIITTDTQVIIQDLGSTNGTFVNGEKIKKARLKEGDRILVGTSILKLISVSDADQPDRPLDDAEIKSMMQQVATNKKKSSSPMSGRIDEVPLPDLLQLFSTSKKTGVMVIKTDEHEGKIYLKPAAYTMPAWMTTTIWVLRRHSTESWHGKKDSLNSPLRPQKNSCWSWTNPLKAFSWTP